MRSLKVLIIICALIAVAFEFSRFKQNVTVEASGLRTEPPAQDTGALKQEPDPGPTALVGRRETMRQEQSSATSNLVSPDEALHEKRRVVSPAAGSSVVRLDEPGPVTPGIVGRSELMRDQPAPIASSDARPSSQGRKTRPTATPKTPALNSGEQKPAGLEPPQRAPPSGVAHPVRPGLTIADGKRHFGNARAKILQGDIAAARRLLEHASEVVPESAFFVL